MWEVCGWRKQWCEVVLPAVPEWFGETICETFLLSFSSGSLVCHQRQVYVFNFGGAEHGAPADQAADIERPCTIYTYGERGRSSELPSSVIHSDTAWVIKTGR